MVTNSEDAEQLSNYMKENFVETDKEKAARIKQVWNEMFSVRGKVISFADVTIQDKNQSAC